MLFTEKEKTILNSAFEKYIEELCNDLPNKDELEHVTFSNEFLLKMQRLLKAEKKFYYRMFNTVGKKVASIILAIFIGLTATVLSVEALRESFINFIIETFKLGAIVRVTDSYEEFNFIKLSPQYITDGFILESEVEVDSNIYKKVYSSNDSSFIIYTQSIATQNLTGINTENITYEKIYIGTFEAITYSKNDTFTIIFTDNYYTYKIYSTLPKEELIKIAESIF